MSEKDELIYKIKNLAIDPESYRNGEELIKLMDYYGVNNLTVLDIKQLKEYYEKECNRKNRSFKGGTT